MVIEVLTFLRGEARDEDPAADKALVVLTLLLDGGDGVGAGVSARWPGGRLVDLP